VPVSPHRYYSKPANMRHERVNLVRNGVLDAHLFQAAPF
jgi:hypothetical protein